MTPQDLATRLGAELRGPGDAAINRCAPLSDAGPGDLTFLNNRRYAHLLPGTRASAVILQPRDLPDAPAGAALLVTDDVYLAFRHAMAALHGNRPRPEPGISPLAVVDETAELGERCTVCPGVTVGPRAVVGDRTVLYPGVYLGEGARVGDDCTLYPGVCVYDGCTLGDRVTLHANTVIGQDGLGYATSPRKPGQGEGDADRDGDAPADEVIHHKVPPAGNAVVEDDVEMGANCSIDRATLGSTVVGAGTKFSNSVTIGHGARIGRHNLFVAQVGVAGSTVTGDYCVFGGQVGVGGHLVIGSRVQIAASSKVMHDIPDGETWGGTPARPFTDMKRILLQQQRLPDMAAELKRLRRRLDTLEAAASVRPD